MGSDMAAVILAAAGGAVVTLLGVALVVLVRRRNRSRADLEAMLLSAQHEADDLRARLEEVTARLHGAPAERASVETAPAYLITDVGGARQPAVPAEERIPVPDRLVLSATMGEPLVKVVAFGHGLRRALAPESRNRIWFEMRREVRAARKRRRQLLKQYQRDIRAAERAGEGLA